MKECCDRVLRNIFSATRLFFSRPTDPYSLAGRSHIRYQRATLTAVSQAAYQIVTILTGIFVIPITLNYLGDDLFGIWMVIISFVSFLWFCDFGIGIGLRNKIIECLGNDDLDSPRMLIANAIFVLVALAVIILLIAFTVLPLLPWSSLIKCKNPESVPHILPAVRAVICMFALGIPIAQLQNIANAYQRGYWANLCFLIGRIAGFFFIIWCVKQQQPLWVLAGGYVGLPYLVTFLGWIVFLIAVPSLRPWPFRPEMPLIRSLFGIGFYVMIHRVSYSFSNISALILIANTINAASAVPYSITHRLLGVSTIITGAMMFGISVAVGEAWYRKDIEWIRTTVRRSELVVFIFGIAPLMIFFCFGREIILWWTKSPEAVPSILLLLASVFWMSTRMIGSIYNQFLIAINKVRFIALVELPASIAFILCGYIMGTLTKSPTMIIFLQFFIGALIPSWLFRQKMRRLLIND